MNWFRELRKKHLETCPLAVIGQPEGALCTFPEVIPVFSSRERADEFWAVFSDQIDPGEDPYFVVFTNLKTLQEILSSAEAPHSRYIIDPNPRASMDEMLYKSFPLH